MIRVLVVDDHELVRRSLRAMLADRFAGAVVDEAGTSEDAIRRVTAEPWDLVMLDLVLGGDRGFDTLRRIKHVRPDTAVLVMSMHPEEPYGAAARGAGAAGYVVKGAPPDEIVAAVERALAG